MVSYLRQVAICESVQETIKRALTKGDNLSIRLKVYNIPTTESILRAVSLSSSVDTDERLKDFISEHILGSLRLTADQRDHLNLNG
ncbi:MAG: hypothetical protein C0392_14085 [Syntrophus sp. (in: bacteria)]|nr:hypothetical protein [Syntrophus sp. (in: bacteria)]